MAKEVKMRDGQVKDERGIFEGLLRFARYRPSRPGVTAGQPPAENAAHLERLVNAGPVAPYPVNSLVMPEAEHDAAGEPGSQSSVLSG